MYGYGLVIFWVLVVGLDGGGEVLVENLAPLGDAANRGGGQLEEGALAEFSGGAEGDFCWAA